MKTVKLFSLTVLMMAFAGMSFAQSKTETVKVSGECGMCKKKIEKAAKDAGATYALWNKDTKILTVKYNSSSTNTAKIEKKIAGVGYDTPDFKATDEAYNKLDECCQYERNGVKTGAMGCSDKCEMKDGKCKDEAACKEKGCCNDSEKCKEMGCCGHEKSMAANGKMDCCKKGADGKSAMNCSKDEKAGCCSKKATTQQ
jgi:periplasmic mercuric ion binding protein